MGGKACTPCKLMRKALWSHHHFLNTHNTLQWRHNEHDGVSNHQPCDCLFNRLLRHRWKKTSKLRVTGLCAGNSPVSGEFPAQMTSNAENVSIWWRHHEVPRSSLLWASFGWHILVQSVIYGISLSLSWCSYVMLDRDIPRLTMLYYNPITDWWLLHDDAIVWTQFPHYWPFVRRIHW